MEDMTRIPPHSVESEQSILGSILLDKDAIITVTETIKPDDFYKEAHKIIYECMAKDCDHCTASVSCHDVSDGTRL